MSTTTAPAGRHRAAPSGQPPRPLAALGQQLRFVARRDRVRGSVWVAAVVGIFASSTWSVIELYSTPSELQSYGELASADPALKAVAGPGYGLDDPTQGAVVMNEMGLYTLIAVALMCLFLVLRHTRSEEETDRAELVRSAPVGRYASLTAALIWVGALNLVVAVGVTASLLAFGLATGGSVAYGLALLGIGAVFTGIAGVVAQVADSARAATALGGALLGLFFLLRAVGDLGNGWMSWLSPLGWAQGIRPYADERWWVLGPLALAAGLLVVGAVALSSGRDLGAGFLSQRPGPANAGPRLASPVAMAARLQRGSLVGWTVGVAVTGFFFGIVADQADSLLENEAVADFLAQSGAASPTDSFLATIVLMIALLASGFTVSSVLRLRGEELAGRADPTIASPVSRRRWAASHLVVAVVGSAVMLLAGGLAAGLAYALQVGDLGEAASTVGAALVMLPALAVLAGLAFALFGLVSRWSPLAWAGLALGVLVGLLAETLNLPQWTRDLSPFEHVPAMPAESFALAPVAALCAVAAALVAVGFSAIGRRDIG